MTYTAAHDTGPLTHWARPRTEPETSWILVKFVTTEPQWEPHPSSLFFYYRPSFFVLMYLSFILLTFRCKVTQSYLLLLILSEISATRYFEAVSTVKLKYNNPMWVAVIKIYLALTLTTFTEKWNMLPLKCFLLLGAIKIYFNLCIFIICLC